MASNEKKLNHTKLSIIVEHTEDFDAFHDKFVELIEAAGWTFGGGLYRVTDGDELDDSED